MSALLVVIGVGLIVFAFVDLVNTLVSTGTSARPWWPSRALALAAFGAVRWVASRFGEESRTRELLLTGSRGRRRHHRAQVVRGVDRR